MSVLSINWLDINTEDWNLSIRHQGHQESRQRIFWPPKQTFKRKKESPVILSIREKNASGRVLLGLHTVDIKNIFLHLFPEVWSSSSQEATPSASAHWSPAWGELRNQSEDGVQVTWSVSTNQKTAFYNNELFKDTLVFSRGWWHFSRWFSRCILLGTFNIKRWFLVLGCLESWTWRHTFYSKSLGSQWSQIT